MGTRTYLIGKQTQPSLFAFLREANLGRGWAENRAAILTLRFTLILVTSFALLTSGDPGPGPVALGLLAMLLASQLWLARMRAPRFADRRVQTGLVVVDLAAITGALALTDDARSDLFLAYFLVLLLVSLSGSLKRVTAVAAGACAAYALGLWVVYSSGNEVPSPAVLMHLPMLFVAGVFFGLVAQASRDEHTALIESRHEREALGAVLDLTERLNANLEPAAVVDTVAERLSTLVPRACIVSVLFQAEPGETGATVIRPPALEGGEEPEADPTTLASVPMLLRERVVGAMVVSAAPPLTPPELKVARILANVATHALVNSHLFRAEHEAAERFRRLEAEHRRLLDSADDWIAVYRTDGTVVSWNLGAERITGVPRTDAIGSRVDRFFAVGSDVSWFLRLLRRGTVHTGLETMRVRGDGTERVLVSTLSPLPGDGSGEARVLEIAKDLTDQRLLAARLDQAEKMSAMGNLISGVAHELNNPLTTVLLAARQMERSGSAPPDKLQLLLGEAQRATRIVADLLAYARPSHEAHTAVDLGDAVRAAVRSFRGVYEGMPDVHVLVEPGVPTIQGSTREIEQALVNLLRNAAQAMHGAGDIRVHAYHAPDKARVHVDVEDQGPGVPAGIRARIFDPFFTTKPPGEGTGLGLSLVQRIMLSHRGGVEVADRVGGGGLFRLSFPAGVSPMRPLLDVSATEIPRA